jgi:glycosyltransferase involved in cell wall biosynthesis
MRKIDDSMPLRICLAVPCLAPYAKTNGIAWYNRWLADGLVKKGHFVTVIDVSMLERQSVAEPWGESVVMRGSGRGALPKSLRRAIFVRNYLTSNKAFDIFETSNWPGLAALRPRSMAITFIRLITPSGHGGMGNLRNMACGALEAISVRRADAVIASTSYIQQSLSSLYKVDLHDAYRVSFGIPDVQIRSPRNAEGQMRFISIGRAEGRKGSDILLEALLLAFNRHEDFRATLIGSYGSFVKASDKLQQIWATLTTEHMKRLTVIENVEEDAKLALLADSDYLLMTSRTESFGLPVIEAMRAGTAVVSSVGGGLREVAGASADNILYENPEDPELLAETILAAVRQGRPHASKRGAAARKTYVDRFSEDVFIDGTIAAYRDRLERARFGCDR